MINAISNLPTPMKAGGGAVATGGVLGAAYIWFHDLTFILIIVGGILLLVLLYLAWKYYSRLGKSRNLKRILSGAQTGAADTDDGTNVQAIRDEFYEGLKTFLTRAKNPESKPWYLVVGESSSGKTQAIINSQLRFIMKSAVGGLGGTMGMKWWFTQEAVILDTAGRLMLPPEQNQSSLAWREFLEILKKERSNCPINGLFLMISAQSLLEYSSEKINEVAGIIASRFEEVQDELGVRFPVYVFITKCDLINGFNEFFEDLSDPRLQNQMLGWSNPANLDEDFDPKLVDEHLEDIRQRMLRRRAKLLLNPPPSADPAAKRLDQVDALFNLPDSITKIGSRLRLYLETIFAGGADEKHLFLRGIYFTCAMQRGAPIDADLAAALGVPLSQLPKERVMNRMRSFFLRDVFVEKAFRERGLVTRAHNVSADKVRKRALILGSSIGMVCLLIGITALNAYQLSESLKPFKFFEPLSSEQYLPYKSAVIVTEGSDKKVVYTQAANIEIENKKFSATDMLDQSQQLASKPISAPLMLKPIGLISSVVSGSSLTDSVRTAHSMLFESLVLQPLVNSVRHKMLTMSKADWENLGDDRQVTSDALVELIKLEKPRPATGPLLDFKALLKFLLGKSEYDAQPKYDSDVGKLNQVLNWTYSSTGGNATWPPKAFVGGSPAITAGVNGYIAFCKNQQQNSDKQGQALLDISRALKDLQIAENKLARDTGTDAVADNGEYALQSEKWKGLATSVSKCGVTVDGLVKKLENDHVGYGTDSLDTLFKKVKSKSFEEIDRDMEVLRDQVPETPGPLHDARSALDRNIDQLKLTLADINRPDNPDISELKNFNTLYLISGADLDQRHPRRYRVHCDIVRQAIDKFPADSGATSALASARAAPADPLDTSISALKMQLDKQIADWDTHSSDDAEDEQLNKLQASCKWAINGLVRPKKRTELVSAQIDRLKNNLEEWKDASTAMEAKSLSVAMASRQVVPMTAMNAGPFDLAFSPDFARQMLGVLATLDDVLADGKLLDRATLQKRLDAKKTGWADYTARYTAYWSSDVLSDITVPEESWEKIHKRFAADDANPDTVHEKLKIIGTQMRAALEALNDPRVTPQIAVIQQGITRAKTQDFVDRCRKVTRGWRDLDPDPLLARKTLLNPGRDGKTAADKFTDDYTVGKSSDDYVLKYWQRLITAAIQSLASSANNKAGEDIVAKLAAAQHFPLVPPDSHAGETDLTPDQLKTVRGTIAKLSSTSADAPTGVGDGDALGPIAKLNALDKYAEWLKKVGPVLAAIPDDAKAQTFTVTLMSSADGFGSCHDIWISQGSGPQARSSTLLIRPPKDGSKFDRTFTLPGGPIIIQAGDSGNPNPASTFKWTFGSDSGGGTQTAEYSLLRLLLDKKNDVETTPEGDLKVTMHASVPLLNGNPRNGTVVLLLSIVGQKGAAPIPPRANWPASVLDADTQTARPDGVPK